MGVIGGSLAEYHDLASCDRVSVWQAQRAHCFFCWPFSIVVLQSAVPEPTAPEVYIETVPATKYYVAAYGGWTYESKLIEVSLLIQQARQSFVFVSAAPATLVSPCMP